MFKCGEKGERGREIRHSVGGAIKWWWGKCKVKKPRGNSKERPFLLLVPEK